ncbi:MAG: Asp-tRNA(Asn)/Glu-tRNA(Gln) amidotransferase GatCAB subunit A, partial [Alcanivoracaceae bacterium]|nr:Asp-tRNA(Asn)/Glu-tRNA(Gln) amidotransferase GatCAB subunit A [Alcanivoracaceae bacterium]
TGAVSGQGGNKTYFERIEEKKHLNAYVTLMHDEALQRAKDSDERRKKNKALPLDGLPIAVKDNFCTAGVLTTAGSKILGNFVPTYESFVTQKLLDAGAVFLGKTNMDEFGMGSSTEKSMHGPTINPNVRSDGTQVVPGGSSGGSAAAVAADLAVAAIGTDTGGSLRQPAAFCGVVGFKPSYGHCSRWGVIAYGSSLDQPGTITKSVADAAILLDVMI